MTATLRLLSSARYRRPVRQPPSTVPGAWVSNSWRTSEKQGIECRNLIHLYFASTSQLQLLDIVPTDTSLLAVVVHTRTVSEHYIAL